jgi:hypothetical protein
VGAHYDEIGGLLSSPTANLISRMSVNKFCVDRSCISDASSSQPLQRIARVVPAQVPFDRVGMEIARLRFKNPKERDRQT